MCGTVTPPDHTDPNHTHTHTHNSSVREVESTIWNARTPKGPIWLKFLVEVPLPPVVIHSPNSGLEERKGEASR